MFEGGDVVHEMDGIYKEHAQMVFRYLISLCKEEQLAEELTQETFYRAIKSSNRYDGTCKILNKNEKGETIFKDGDVLKLKFKDEVKEINLTEVAKELNIN